MLLCGGFIAQGLLDLNRTLVTIKMPLLGKAPGIQHRNPSATAVINVCPVLYDLNHSAVIIPIKNESKIIEPNRLGDRCALKVSNQNSFKCSLRSF